MLDRFSPPIVGRRLIDGEYVDVPTEASGGLHSEILDLELCMVDGEFRFREVGTGAIIPDYIELDDIGRAATRRVAALEEERRRLKG